MTDQVPKLPSSCVMLLLAACAGSPEVRAPAPITVPANEARLRGRVTSGGRPASGVVVALCPPAPPGAKFDRSMAIETALVDDDGCYAFLQPLAPGEYVLLVWERRLAEMWGSSMTLPSLGRLPLFVFPGEALPPIDLVLP